MRFTTLLLQTSALALMSAGTLSAAQGQTAPVDPNAAAPTTVTDQSTTKNDALPQGAPKLGEQASGTPVAPETLNADGSVVDNADNTVVVTGSRIRRKNLVNIAPTITTDRQYIEERNFTNVADALNLTPGVRGSITPNGAQGSFGQGVNFVNQFGLGSNRTLTLVDGRRFVTSNPNTLFNQGSAGQQVDVNVIQSILVDHIDQTSITGATAYGSDAIAGTVNYVLRDRYDGLQVTGLSGVTDKGDGFRYNAAFLAGHDFLDGRLNVTVAYTRDRQDGVLFNDRDFYTQNFASVTNPCSLTVAQGCAASNNIGPLGRPGNGITPANDGRINPAYGYNNTSTDGNPGTVLIRNESIYYLTRLGLITAAAGTGAYATVPMNYQFDANGNIVPFNKGITFPSIYASGGDGLRLNDFSQITSNLTRDTVNTFVHYDVSKALKFYFEGEFFRSVGDQLVRQPSYNSNVFAGANGPLTFSVTSPFLTTQARNLLTQNGVTLIQVSRASTDLADLSGETATRIGRAVLGAMGDFTWGGHDFNYDVYANYGRTTLHDLDEDVNRQNFINAVNVTANAAGQIVCTATPARQAAPGGTPVADPNCVPLNLLNESQITAAARAYVIQNTQIDSLLQQKDFVATFGGSPLTLFGNDYGFNVSYEHREEDGAFTPDYFTQQGLGRSAAIAPVSGKYNVDEVDGEVALPIVQPRNDLRFLHALEIDGGARYVNNTVNGGFLAWSAGGFIAPVKDLQLRASYTKSFRAPALTELFLPRSPSFVNVPDLCSPTNINAGSVPAIRAKNCAAFLAKYPNATPLDAAAATVPGISGGNPTLQNEVSYSYSYGGVFQPHFVPGLTITVDYIDIRIHNPIANLTIAQIASGCFDNANFNADDPANGNAFCSQIQRYAAGQAKAINGGDAAGQVVNNPVTPGVNSGYVNGNRIFFSGIQSTINYSTPLEAIRLPGRFETDNTIFYVNRRLSDITGVAPQRTDGIFGDPKFQWRQEDRWILPEGGISGAVNFTGKQIAVRTALSPDLREFNRLPAYATYDLSFWVNVEKKFRLTLAVTNITDKEYIPYLDAVNPNGIIDALGRRYSISARAQF